MLHRTNPKQTSIEQALHFVTIGTITLMLNTDFCSQAYNPKSWTAVNVLVGNETENQKENCGYLAEADEVIAKQII